MHTPRLYSLIEEASFTNKVIYFYDDGDYQINNFGLTDIIQQGGHNIILEIDCTGQNKEHIIDEYGSMFEANINEILENYDLTIILEGE